MTGDIIKISIENLVYGGRGIARTPSGKAVLVSGVISGELVNARIIKEHSSYIEACAEEILEASPSRIKPECCLFGVCGGCDWQHIDYHEQLLSKDAIVLNHLKKDFDIKSAEHCLPAGSPKIYEYRNLIRLQFSNGSAGFFKKNSHVIVQVRDCLLAERKIRDVLPFLMKMIYKNISLNLVSLEVISSDNDIRLIAHARKSTDNLHKEFNRICYELNIPGAIIVDKASNSLRIIGDRCFHYNIDTKQRRFSIRGGLGGFIQANHYVNQFMIQHVLDLTEGSSKVLDLYSGCGNFTIPMAANSSEVTALDHDSRLLSYVKDNAADNGLNNVAVVKSKATDQIWNLPEIKKGFDTVILDPPRTGAKEITGFIGKINPEKIVYISCNPSTLARDVNAYKDYGYRIKSLRVFDMFPQTYHIESVVCLEHQH